MSFIPTLPKDIMTLIYQYEPDALNKAVKGELNGKQFTICHLEEVVEESSKEGSTVSSFHSRLILGMLAVDRLFPRLGSSLQNLTAEYRPLAIDFPLEKIDLHQHADNSTKIKWQLFIQLTEVETQKLEDIVSTHSANFNPLEKEFVESAQSVRKVKQIIVAIASSNGWQPKDLESNNELVGELPKLGKRDVGLVAFGITRSLRKFSPSRAQNFVNFMLKVSDSSNFKGNLLKEAATNWPTLFKIQC